MSALQNSMAKHAKQEWIGDVPDFHVRVMDSGWPYFVISCACGCCRLDCAVSDMRGSAPIVVTPVVNRDKQWQALWGGIH